MNEIIKLKLKEIEEKEDVKMIYAIESGSRAWGFASRDSDYDVRFIYVRKPDFYLKLEKTRDVIEWQLDDTFDINGWDLKKAMQLLYHSNPTLFEWMNSSIIYKESEEWEWVKEVFQYYFSCKKTMHHYLSSAIKNYRENFKEDKVKLKKYFYVIRPLLACRWIMEKKTPPPILFEDLVEEMLEDDMKEVIHQFVLLKKESIESDLVEREEALDCYIEKSIIHYKNVLKEEWKEDKDKDYNKLNEVFLKVLSQSER